MGDVSFDDGNGKALRFDQQLGALCIGEIREIESNYSTKSLHCYKEFDTLRIDAGGIV